MSPRAVRPSANPGHLGRLRAESSAGEPSTRGRLLDAAMELFYAQGFHATGVAAILERAGVHSGSLYHHFATKEDLAAALLARYEEQVDRILFAPARARSEDPIERLFLVLDGYRQLLASTGCALGCPVGNLALELADTHPALRPRIAACFARWRAGVVDLLTALGGRLPGGTDLESLACFVLSAMEGAVMQSRVERRLEPFERTMDELRRHFESLLGPARGAARPRRSRAPAARTTTASIPIRPAKQRKKD